VAWCKKNIFKNIRTRGNCGSWRKLSVVGRKIIRRATVAPSKKGVVRKNWFRAKVEQGTWTAGKCQESKMGRKDLGCRRQYLRLRSMGKGDENYRKTNELEAVKRATEVFTGLMKMWNWTIWRCRCRTY
jgi:hypothetical protein